MEHLSVWNTGSVKLVAGRCDVRQTHWIVGPPQARHRVMFSRRGAILQRINGIESFSDSTTFTVLRPGDDLSVAHPLGCGDDFTLLELGPELADDLSLHSGGFTLTDDLDLDHRRLVASARRGVDRLELGERIQALLGRLPGADSADGPAHATATHRRLAVDACGLLAQESYALGLDEIAGSLNCSPHHLSRVFRHVTGQTLTAYRNRARVRRVLADLQDGVVCLREVAAKYGFADQAHMIRVVRRHLGQTPTAVRAQLRA